MTVLAAGAPSPENTQSEGWELPASNVTLYDERRHAYALVIPVINEGERIRGQLIRIRDAGLPVDVIVADGGSTDGSLNHQFVGTAGVRAVLTKTGPGKLGAQLRMAYAWCLREGYTGIVTIDGNGKDGVNAVADMVSRLEEGYDYVQGSRYLPGGLAENTPLERNIANRCIHAPLMSLAGRHWYTDTTNGFRAYSARYLLHPRVQPFRDIFQRYELLFYLTIRAGQLGMRVAHVPVQRRYPENTATPTKIAGFSGKLSVLKQALAAALGRYDPKR
jgi:dolichol-phosphate mannosyltransferase